MSQQTHKYDTGQVRKDKSMAPKYNTIPYCSTNVALSPKPLCLP